jgi:hypothetical protein
MSKSKNIVGSKPTEEKLPIDTVHNLLASRRRRYTLYCLYRYENPVRLPDVADQITAWETIDPPHFESSLQTYKDLYHCHIPKLTEAGIVSYCQPEDVVTLAKNAPQLRPYLEQAAETDLSNIDSHGL